MMTEENVNRMMRMIDHIKGRGKKIVLYNPRDAKVKDCCESVGVECEPVPYVDEGKVLMMWKDEWEAMKKPTYPFV